MDGPSQFREWRRTYKTVKEKLISPSKSFQTEPPENVIDHSLILPDGSITEITQYTDLMCKDNVETEFYIVSKTYPHIGYSIVQHFRKVNDVTSGIQTYIRGECIEYKTGEFQPQIDNLSRVQTLEEVLASFHIQRQLTSKILYLSKPLLKINERKAVKRLNTRPAAKARYDEFESWWQSWNKKKMFLEKKIIEKNVIVFYVLVLHTPVLPIPKMEKQTWSQCLSHQSGTKQETFLSICNRSSQHYLRHYGAFLNKHLRWSFFAKIVNGSKPLTIFVKNSILDIWRGSE